MVSATNSLEESPKCNTSNSSMTMDGSVSLPDQHPNRNLDAHFEVRNEKGTKATIEDIIRVSMLNQYYGAQRFLGNSILDEETQKKLEEKQTTKEGPDPTIRRQVPKYFDKKSAEDKDWNDPNKDFLKRGEYVVPLHKEEDTKHGPSQMARNATPMSMLVNDRNVQFLMEEMELRGFKRYMGETIDLTPYETRDKWVQLMYDTLFSNGIFRVLGRTDPYRHFGRRANLKHNLPKPDQLELFLKCVSTDAHAFPKSGINDRISKQHEGQIPSEWLKLVTFKRFSRGYRDSLRPALEKFYDDHATVFSGGRFTDRFEEMVDMMEALLQSLCQKQANLRWLAQSIVGDPCEFFDEPFGEIKEEHLVGGYGAKEALKMLQNAGLCNQKKNAKKNFRDAMKKIVNHVHNVVPEDNLDVMGLYKKEGVVRQKINGTKFGPRHAEHWMCKFYVQVKFTWSSYRKTLKPQAGSPHCWPRKWRKEDCVTIPQALRDFKKLMEETVRKFRQIMNGNDQALKYYLTVPPVLIVPGEVIAGISS